MKLKFTLMMALVLFTGISQSTAQMQEWKNGIHGKAIAPKHALQKPELLLEKAKTLTLQNAKLYEGMKSSLSNEPMKKITEDWWEPDTISNISLSGISSQRIYEFNENGYLNWELFQLSGDAGISWVDVTRSDYSYDGQDNKIMIIVQRWNITDTIWINDQKAIYTYDNNGNMLTEIIDYWNEDKGEWIPDYRATYTYDNHDRVLTGTYEREWTWDEEGWVYVGRETTTYNTFGNILVKLTENWIAGGWVDAIQETNTYNEDEYRLTSETLNGGDSGWRKYINLLCVYDERNNITESTLQFGNDVNEWENYGKDELTYDQRNNELSMLQQLFNTTSQEWGNFLLYEQTYDERNNMLTRQIKDWLEGEWIIYQKDTYAYDANNNITSVLTQIGNDLTNSYRSTNTYRSDNQISEILGEIWGGTASGFISDTYESYLYDANDDLESYEAQSWNGTQWVNVLKRYYTYDEHHNGTSVSLWYWGEDMGWLPLEDFFLMVSYNNGESYYEYMDMYQPCHELRLSYVNLGKETITPNSLDQKVCVYPNPTNGELRIKNGELNIQHIQIFDITGRLLQNINNGNNSEINIDLSNYAGGIYLVKINEQTIKVVKQ